MTGRVNLKVLVLDRDFFALESLNSYLAWDRRTRVKALTYSMAEARQALQNMTEIELPDVILLESEAFASAEALSHGIAEFRRLVKDVTVICLCHEPDARRAAAAAEAGARAYLLRNEVKMQLVGAICYAAEHDFVVTHSIHNAASAPFEPRIFQADILPREPEFPGMTDRVMQALWLCVIEGMPAQLAADEMGVSPHTVRSYIKEGYRLLEAVDNTQFSDELGPLERAFMRFTALNPDVENDNPRPVSG